MPGGLGVQHMFIKKVAFNSGGKLYLVLSSDGNVSSWGEGDDGKLGHDNKNSCDQPRIIEGLYTLEKSRLAAML